MPIDTLRISRTHAADPERQSAIEERLIGLAQAGETRLHLARMAACLLYTSDAADE